MFRKLIRAFTLVELSIVLIIGALTIIFASASLYEFGKEKKITDNENKLLRIEKALQDFFKTNKRLPCPADKAADRTVGSATEEYISSQENIISCTNTTVATCSVTLSSNSYIGVVPAATLGLGSGDLYDSWGGKILYAVDRRFACSDSGQISELFYSSSPEIEIQDVNSTTITNDAIYVLVSYGQNSYGSYNYLGIQNTVSSDSKETENSDIDNIFIHSEFRYFVEDNSNSYDDYLRFKTKQQLIVETSDNIEKFIGDECVCSDNSSFNDDQNIIDVMQNMCFK